MPTRDSGDDRGEDPTVEQGNHVGENTSGGFDDDFSDEPAGWGDRSSRKSGRERRRDIHAQRLARLRHQRQAEPSSPVVVVVAIVLLAVIVLGFGGGLPRLLGRDDETADTPVRLLTPAVPVGRPTEGGTGQATSSALPSSAATSTASVPPVMTERPSPAVIAAADRTASSWARTFYTRDPTAETYEQLVTKVDDLLTPEVAASFRAAGDPTYEALRADDGRSTVATVRVNAPGPGIAPVDTPTRISRLVTVVIDVTGKRPDRITLPQLVTLTPQGGEWVISDVNGGIGP